MNRPIPAGDYVEHFDPELPHHRALLLALLEQLVAHQPQALGGWRHAALALDCPSGCRRSGAGSGGRDPRRRRRGPPPGEGVRGLQALAHFGVTARLVQSADFQLIEQQIARGITVPCGYIHRGQVERPTGSGHWLIVYGHTSTQVMVNDPWGEPDLIGGTTLNPNGMGLRFSRQNYRCAGLRLRKALDGGADRWRCLPLCPRQGLGSGGGQHSLRSPRLRCGVGAAGPSMLRASAGVSPTRRC